MNETNAMLKNDILWHFMHTHVRRKLFSSVYKCVQNYNRTFFGWYRFLKGSAPPHLLEYDINKKLSDNI